MKVSIQIDFEEFPLLKDFKKETMEDILYKLIKTGYNIHFPSLENISKQSEQSIIIDKINQFTNKIESSQENVQNIVNKLIGISTNSNKKGNFAENMLEDYISSKYSDITFERKSSQAHSGDAWLYINEHIIMLESKNYLTVINKDEVAKLKSDMINHHIRWGIMVSFNSTIQGTKEFDFTTFNHNNESYYIIMISNLANDMARLDLAIQITRKIIDKFINPIKFPWIIDEITKTIHELNDISKRNYLLRDIYYTMEKEINNQLHQFYIKLREYQFDIDFKINELVNKIESSINNKTKKPINKYSIINQYIGGTNNKILYVLTRLLDTFDKKNWYLVDNDIYQDEIIIGTIKIQTKKIIINIFENYTIYFDIYNTKQLKNSINMLLSL